MRDHPSIRAITMIAVTAVIFAAAVMAEPVRTMDAICIVVDGDGPHVLDERSEERTDDDLPLLRRSLGDKSHAAAAGAGPHRHHHPRRRHTHPHHRGRALSSPAAAQRHPSGARTRWWS